jgi:hypothetical protein
MSDELKDFCAIASASLAVERAKGIPLPQNDLVEMIYRLGFAAGSSWALQQVGLLQGE